jgi:hypothetical protein
MQTTTTCARCGCEIPTAIIGDAFCTECRYSDRSPWAAPMPEATRTKLKDQIGELKRDKPKGWEQKVKAICRQLERDEPHPHFDVGPMYATPRWKPPLVHTAPDEILPPIASLGVEREGEQPKSEIQAQAEAVSRVVQWLNDGTRTPEQAFRKIKLADHFFRPVKKRIELAKDLGLTPGRVTQLLNEFSAKISQN